MVIMQRALWAVMGLMGLAPAAFGHGVQIQFSYNTSTGKIESREIISTTAAPGTDTDPYPTGFRPHTSLSDFKRVYVMPLVDQNLGAGQGWYVQPTPVKTTGALGGATAYPTGPGLTYQFDSSALAGGLAGTNFAFSGSAGLFNLSGRRFAYQFTTGLKKYDAGSSSFGDAGTAQAQMFTGSGGAFTGTTQTAISSDAPDGTLMALSTITNGTSTNPHSSLGFRLLGDGASSSSALADGVYVIGMTVTSYANLPSTTTLDPSSGVGTSDPFYYVMFKGISQDQAAAWASDFAAGNGIGASQIQAVPEPGVLGLAGVAGLMALVRRSRRGECA